MQTSTLPLPTLPAIDGGSARPFADRPFGDDPASAFGRVRGALAANRARPADAAAWADLRAALRAAATVIAQLPRRDPQGFEATEARQLVREISAAGVHDLPADPADLALADKLVSKGWPGVLAGMLLASPWQWPNAPVLQAVPAGLLPDYVAWLFAQPLGFIACGQVERYAAHTLARLEELLRWVNRSPGFQIETEVLHAYATGSSVIPLYFASGDLRRHAELRGRLLTRRFAATAESHDATATPRAGRRLRVGIVSRHFGPQTETYTTLPTFEQLDPDRFEVILFAHLANDSAVETYCRQHASDFILLPEDLEGQLATLRGAALDVAVFGTNLTAVCNQVACVALHRVAALQVANNSSCITTGLPEVDLYVSGTFTESAGAAAHFSERLGLLPGPAHAFNYDADRQEPQITCRRAEFGLPDDAVVFVSAANYYKITPEMQHAWARLLAAVPGSRLLLHPFNANWVASYPTARFRVAVERVLAEHGIDPARLAISTKYFPSRTDVKALLALGDVYLDTFPFGGVNSLVDPLELGLPVVAWEGDTFRSRMGSALLRTLEIPELIATNEADYRATVVKLAIDPAERAACSARIRQKMERAPIFLDPLAASDAFGDLLETAYDELAAVGRPAFRANRTPLRSTSLARSFSTGPARARAILRASPADPAARHEIGRALLDNGQTGRAVTYLLGALQGEEKNAGLWLDAARALHADGQTSEAIRALEAGLRIDMTLLDGWILFAQLAQQVGSAELAREAAGVARQLAPDDPRVTALF